MLASPIHLQTSPSITPDITSATSPENSSPQAQHHILDFAALSTPIPSVALTHPPSPGPSPPASIFEKRQRRRSRLPSFFFRLSSASPGRPSRKQSSPLLHKPAASADAGDIASLHPRDSSPGNQESRIESLTVSAPAQNSANPSLVASPSTRSKSSSIASSSGPASGTLFFPATERFPKIFTSTASCRLSVPLTALHHLQTITQQDISRKMHQTSSRLLRMTDDERPYTRVCMILCSFDGTILSFRYQ